MHVKHMKRWSHGQIGIEDSSWMRHRLLKETVSQTSQITRETHSAYLARQVRAIPIVKGGGLGFAQVTNFFFYLLTPIVSEKATTSHGGCTLQPEVLAVPLRDALELKR